MPTEKLRQSEVSNTQNASKDGANNSSGFQKFISGFWPVHNNELAKFFSITALMFCILFIQNVIRATKDSVVNTMIGPESISFLKFWGVMPAAVLYAAIYVKLVNSFKPETLFYLIISSFISFFFLFGFIIFPFHESLHMSKEYAEHLIDIAPNFKWFILLAANWGFSLFYIVAELWPNAAYAVLFWQFVNGVTSVDQSKRFYPMFALFGQTGLIISGYLLVAQTKVGQYIYENLGIASSAKIASISFVMAVVVLLGIISLLIFKYINNNILEVRANDAVHFTDKKKKKLSVLESFKFVATSR